jgi:hypothetical protein
MTAAYVDSLPIGITIPLVLAVYTQGGGDYDPCRYIVARSPEGERLNVMECTWHWPDNPGMPVKFQVLTRYLPLFVKSAGIYTIGLYDDPDATDSDHLFPLPVIKSNPLLQPPPQPTTRN